LKEKVGYIEQLSDDKDQRIQDLYEIISSMGDRLTDLIKGEI
jgi:TolA-binding protein